MNHQKLSESMLEIAQESFSASRWCTAIALFVSVCALPLTVQALSKWSYGLGLVSTILWAVAWFVYRIARNAARDGEELEEKAYKLRGGK